MAWIFEPHGLFRQPPFDNEEPWPIGYISEGVGQPLFALHEVIGERPVEELLAASLVMTAAPELLEIALEASNALNSMASQVEAEWRDHDKAASRHDAIVMAFRAKVRAAVSKATGEAK